jgi:hypothetical protein
MMRERCISQTHRFPSEIKIKIRSHLSKVRSLQFNKWPSFVVEEKRGSEGGFWSSCRRRTHQYKVYRTWCVHFLQRFCWRKQTLSLPHGPGFDSKINNIMREVTKNTYRVKGTSTRCYPHIAAAKRTSTTDHIFIPIRHHHTIVPHHTFDKLSTMIE